MKALINLLVLLAIVLSGCARGLGSTQEPAAAGDTVGENLQESTPAGDVSENSIEVIGGDEQSLREFIEQWLMPSGYPGSQAQKMTVYIGSLPGDIPYDLPVPEDARVIGSMTGSWMDYMLIFDTRLTPREVQDFYAKSLVEKGWKAVPQTPGQGFVSQSDVYTGYCYGEEDAFLNVETPSLSDTQTSLRLNLDVSPDSYMCDPQAANPGGGNQNLIPELHAPKGVTVQGSGAGSSDRDAEISASLKGDLTAEELVDFYNEQLTVAGWDMQSSGSGEGAAWSHWTLQDEKEKEWRGTLLAVKSSPDSDGLFALLRIEKAE